jgi:hypothetical protein
MSVRTGGIATLLALAFVGTASGQSLLATEGLGLRVESVDATARALGGVSLGSLTPRVLPGQPTAALDLLAPSITFTGQPSWGDYVLNDEEGSFRGTRFPVVGFSMPVGLRSVINLTLASRFDQRWRVSGAGLTDLRGEVVRTEDTFQSDGGVSELRAGYARWMNPSLAVGATVGLYRGKVNRTFVRQFDTTSVEDAISPFVSGGKWTYFGPTASVDVQWDPISALRVGARVAWSGTLEAEPTVDTEGRRRDIEVPLEVGVGVTAVLSPGLNLTLGFETANWSDLGDPAYDAAASGRVSSFGAGLEWTIGSFWAGDFPIRLGYRRSELPFTIGPDGALETTWSAGFAVTLAETQGIPLAMLDLTGELGDRDSGPLKESFRRISLSFRISGR